MILITIAIEESRGLPPRPNASGETIARYFIDNRASIIATYFTFTIALIFFALWLSALWTIFYVLLALSVIVSLFGMVNTLALSIVERTRELGMIRAVGMTRRQVRRMVRQESVITALIGAVFGLPLGIFLAALVTAALSSEGIVFALPVRSLIVFALVAILAGILAAVIPARRASRLNVLEALQYEEGRVR